MENKTQNTLTPEAAHARNMVPLTDPYDEDQLWMAQNALDGLTRGGIDAALVAVRKKPPGCFQVRTMYEVWRTKPKSLNLEPQVHAPQSAKSLGYHLLRGTK